MLLAEALSIRGLEVKRSKFLERSINPIKDFLALIEIYAFIKKNKIEIVHTYSSKAGILGRCAARLAKVNPCAVCSEGVKVILHTVHGWSFNNCQLGLWQWFFIWLEKLMAKFTDKLIVVSNYDKQKGLNNHIGTEEQYSLIHYGIEYAEFCVEYQGVREELGINSSDLVVGMVSCFKPQKSPEDFIRLANLVNQILPNVKFLLIGDGILRKKIERLIYKFNLQKQVIHTGWRRDISRMLSAVDVFVLTSLWEGLPICVLEAMVKAIPVIATHTGGINEIICEGKTGFLVPCRDMQEMSKKLIILLKDKNLRRQIGINAKNSLGSSFSLENMTKDTQGLYEDLIKAKF